MKFCGTWVLLLLVRVEPLVFAHPCGGGPVQHRLWKIRLSGTIRRALDIGGANDRMPGLLLTASVPGGLVGDQSSQPTEIIFVGSMITVCTYS